MTKRQRRLWRTAKYKTYKRYGRVCDLCGKVGGVRDVHHTFDKHHYPRKRFTIKWLRVVCPICHKKFHIWRGGTRKRCTYDDYITYKEVLNMKDNILTFATILVDVLIVDLGADHTTGVRFMAIYDDEGKTDFVDDNGKASPRALALAKDALYSEALSIAKQESGANIVIPASQCIDTSALGDKATRNIQEDKVYYFDEGTKVLVNIDRATDLDKFMLEHNLLVLPTDLIAKAPITTAGIIDGKYRDSGEAILDGVVGIVVGIIKSSFPLLASSSGIIMSIISLVGGYNGLKKQALDLVFDKVQTELQVGA